MLFKDMLEIDDCTLCPLYKNELCKGGLTSNGYGEPVEPPCTNFDDNTDLDEYVKRSVQWEKEQREKRKKDMEKRRIQKIK